MIRINQIKIQHDGKYHDSNELRSILKTPNVNSPALIDKAVNSGIRVYNENLDLDLLKLEKLFMELEM